jgi:hypothetical protein
MGFLYCIPFKKMQLFIFLFHSIYRPESLMETVVPDSMMLKGNHNSSSFTESKDVSMQTTMHHFYIAIFKGFLHLFCTVGVLFCIFVNLI